MTKAVGVILALLAVFGAGWFVGQRGASDVTPGLDSVIVRSVRTDTLMSVAVRREVVVRAVTDTLRIQADSLSHVLAQALPDTLLPVLAALRASGDSVGALWRAQAMAFKGLADSLKAERDEAIRLLRLKARKPFPIAVVAGVAMTPQGLQPAVSVGFRVPLPRIF